MQMLAPHVAHRYTVLHISYFVVMRREPTMETTKLSSKGQVILPKAIRSTHNWQPGIEFAVEDTPEGVLLRPLKPFKPTSLDAVLGCAEYQGPTKTLEEMEQGITEETKARHARGRY